MSHVDPIAIGSLCGNCGAPLGGAFCHGCGQKAAAPNVSLHDFFHEAVEEFAHVDGKIVRTLRLLLTKPGMLTKEFLDGRRVRYISPLRVYLTCSVLFFALAAFAPQAERPFFRVSKVDGEAGLDPAAVQQLRDAATTRANRAIVHDFPRAMFVLMPFFGLLTWLFYRRQRPFYTAHLYYSIHFHAFVFLAMTIVIPLRFTRGASAVTLGMLAIYVYHYVGLRRVFGGSRWQTAWKGTLLAMIYMIAVLAAILLIGVWSIKESTTPGQDQHQTRFEGKVRYSSGGSNGCAPSASGVWSRTTIIDEI